MPNEMQELIEAAEAVIATVELRLVPTFTIDDLKAAVTAARKASEGGWIPVSQDTPEGEPLLIVYAGVVQHITYTLFEGRWYPHHEDPDDCSPIEDDKFVTHYRQLPSPPLSVENPEVQK